MTYDLTSIFIVIVPAALVLAALIVASVSYVRGINALARYLRTERPDDWHTILALSGGREPHIEAMGSYGLFGLVKGTTRLPIAEEKYRKLLWSVRRRLFACIGFWLALVIAIGWAFRGTQWPHF